MTPVCAEDMTWRWVAALVLLLAVLLFFVSVTVLHDILDGQSGRVEWRDKV
jgi:hypothetical protein